MNCACVIEPGCTRHIKPWVEPGVTSQGPPLEEAPESIRIGTHYQIVRKVLAAIYQKGTARRKEIVIEPALHGVGWRCLCYINESVSGTEPNLYQVWLSARRHFWLNHADKGAA